MSSGLLTPEPGIDLQATAAPSTRTGRVAAIDVVRGALMLLIVLGHASNNLDDSPTSRAFAKVLGPIVEGSTVGFTVVSGIVLASLLASRPDFSRVVTRYRVQAFRLLLVAHPIIAIFLYGSYAQGESFFEFCARRWYLTDSLAVLCALVVPFAPYLSPRARVVVGAITLVGSKVAFCTIGGLLPAGTPSHVAAEALLGTDTHDAGRVLTSTYGILPLGGMFLVGLGIGHGLGLARTETAVRDLARRLLRPAALLVLGSVPLVLAWAAVKGFAEDAGTACLRCILYPQRQLTLFPFWCGVTTLAFCAVALVGTARAARSLAGACEVVGKSSLFAYVFQYLVAQTIPHLLGWDHRMALGPMLGWVVVSSVATWAASAAWGRYTKKI